MIVNTIKKSMVFLLCLYLGIVPCIAKEEKPVDTSSEHIIVYNLDEDKIIYEENAHEKVSIASITKVMSAITILEEVKDLEEMITIKPNVFIGTEGYSMMGLDVGDRISIKDLLYGLMLPSGADAANALALYCAGSIPSFVEKMNEKAKALKLKDTHFANPVGADDKHNYSTAYDLAQLLRYGLKNKIFKEIYTTKKYHIKNLDITLESTLLQYGKRFKMDVSKIEGSKTGFTYDAGVCLSSIATYNDIHYLMIVLGSNVNARYSAIQDSLNLYEYFDQHYNVHTIVEKDQLFVKLPVQYGWNLEEYEVKADQAISAYLKNDYDKKDIKIDYQGIEKLTYQIKKDSKLGQIRITYHDEELTSFDIYLKEDISYYDPILIGILIGSAIILIITMILLKRKKHQQEILVG